MSEIITIDGLEYTKSNKRMRYNPEFHEKHGQPWSIEELIYLCGMYRRGTGNQVSMALGRTLSTCMSKVYYLRKLGLFESYKSRFQNDDL